MVLSPWYFAWLFGRCTCVSIERVPAIACWHRLKRTTPGVRNGCLTALNGYGVGGAFLSADLATDAGGNLHGGEHHPGSVCEVERNGAATRCLAGQFSFG